MISSSLTLAGVKEKPKNRAYDPKRSCWVPIKEGGFDQGVIESTEGDKVTVKVGEDKRIIKKDQVQQVNPPKFERCEDMSNLTYLNDASVLHNLKARYLSKLIYTYSGLFCVAINPYKRFPIYTETAIKLYINKRRNEIPPHIFAIADGGYQSMLTHQKNQSILITGESGAGKTENTKKVIGYFACVGATGKSLDGKASLEDQVVQTNPVLEAFGNAKTVRNDNSSRFGKFIRIHFNQAGKLSGADMEVYLLEKSRITFQQPLERSYHIFYNLMSDAIPNLKKMCLLSNNIKDYHYVSQGKVNVESIDDKEDMQFADEAFDILGFSKEEKQNVYRCTATVMHMGEMKFKQRSSKDDQAVSEENNPTAYNVASLLGIDEDILCDNLVQPKIKVGSEWGYFLKKQFRHLVAKCNETLVDPSMRRITFIVFFNHHMFVLEQEEYVREGIEWAMVDFGMDLQKCIDMFEKPMGVLSILEEESLFPKATDKTFEEKLFANHMGKSPTFQKPKPGGPDKDAHFAVVHYAGTVSYNLTNWLEKNKDPLNDTVIDQIKNGSNKLIVEVKKVAEKKTVSSFYKEQLIHLMTTLHATEPHFIRCIVPNTHKQAGVIDAGLVMHQLTCNGVLEGIRICRKGFPNRMIYEEFKNRYNIMAAKMMAKAKTDKSAAKCLFDLVGFRTRKIYRLGHTKVFFRAGVLGTMEELRDDKVSEILSWLQSTARGSMSRVTFRKMQAQKMALYCVQRSIRNFMIGKTWLWWQLWLAIKPNLRSSKFAEIKATLEAKTKEEAESQISGVKKDRQQAESANETLRSETQELEDNLSKELDKQVNEVAKRLQEEEETCNAINNVIRKLDSDSKRLKDDSRSMDAKIQQCEEDRETKDSQIRSLKEELIHQEDLVNKLMKEKKMSAENRQKTEEDLQIAEDRTNHLNRLKVKLEQNLDEIEDSAKLDIEKTRRKIEGDLRCSQDSVAELDRAKNEINHAVQMKEKELSALAAKIEDEQSLGNKLQKQMQELSSRLSELEEELEVERSLRTKSEKGRQILSRELADLGEKLEESGNATSTQIELNRKRELELAKLKEELDNSALQHESALASLRQKHNGIISDLGDQIDQVNKGKAKVEQQKNVLIMEMNDTRALVEDLSQEKSNIDRQNKMLNAEISDEKSDLEKQTEDAENQLQMLKKLKTSLNTQLEDIRRLADAEARERATLLGKFRNLESDLENIRERIENENEAKGEIQKQMSRALAETQVWKTKFTTEAVARIEDLDNAKSKIIARIEEAEECIDDLQVECERVNALVAVGEKKLTTFDKVVNEWRMKCDDLSTELDASQKDCRSHSSELFRLRAAWDETVEQLDTVKRENKNLADEIKDLLDQLGEGGRSIHELDKQRRRLQIEKEELQSALEEAESALEQEENRVIRLQMEVAQAKQEIERRLSEKEEEFDNTRKNYQRAIDSMQASLDGEIKAKQEALRIKRKLEEDINEMEMALDHSNKANAEAMKQIKRHAAHLLEVETCVEEECRAIADIQDQIGSSERKGNVLAAELDESKMLLETAERAKRSAELEVSESRDAINELTNTNSIMGNQKRKKEEKARKAITDAGRLADELRCEQEHGFASDKSCKSLGAQCSELQNRLDCVESAALKHGRKIISKLEERLRSLENEYGFTQSKTSETHKNFIRTDRNIKEMQFNMDENKKNIEKMGELLDKLQGKIRVYKKQIEDAEEIAALNLAKYRKAQQQLEEAEERSQQAENHMGRYRGSSVGFEH
ncbi:MYH6_7 [Lepeophtheirus salmonis]|uniref:MYH6_7 n=1 Tax=Lepeophtheirus salmonis TaxID=72036 RepID=A0A7R8CNJ5_LEPSM|nr:MYH6_7 [Lepeophtheirus salmonis]CAF2875003.1 MYH6_7 [Lepeophtheirus salmonis]